MNPDFYPDLDFMVLMLIQHPQSTAIDVHRQTPVFSISTNSLIWNKDWRHFQTHIPCNLFLLRSGICCLSPKVRPAHCSPLCLSIWVAKENTMQSGTRRSNILVTWRRDRASSPSSLLHQTRVTPDSHRAISLHTPVLCHRMKDPVPSGKGTAIRHTC